MVQSPDVGNPEAVFFSLFQVLILYDLKPYSVCFSAG